MKTNRLIIAVSIFSILSVSCENRQKNIETTTAEEAVESEKEVLGEDALAMIDDLADEFIGLSESEKPIEILTLSEQDKLVAPDYLLNPDKANYMLTKPQKINTLACLLVERNIRESYGMSLKASDDAIAKLIIDINHPIGFDDIKEKSISQILREEYEICKDRNELNYYWQFQFSILFSTAYVLSQNPEFYFSHITENQWSSFYLRAKSCRKAIECLAEYDSGIAKIDNFIIETGIYDTDRELKTIATAKAFFTDNSEKFAAAREMTFE